MKKGALVIFESTVYPGVTEDLCVPILEQESGLKWKEDCPDLRNTRVIDIIEELKDYGAEVLVHDAMADAGEAHNYYGVDLQPWENMTDLGALIIAVPHRQYRNMPVANFTTCLNKKGCIVDVKSMLDAQEVRKTGINFWRL